MDEDELDSEGKKGGVIVDIRRNTLECEACYFPGDEFKKIARVVSEAVKNHNNE